MWQELVSEFPKEDSFHVPDKGTLTLDDLELGEHLDTGSNAVVYSARWKEQPRKRGRVLQHFFHRSNLGQDMLLLRVTRR